MSGRPHDHLLADEGGATALEFALVLPILVVLLLGLWEIGWSQQQSANVRSALSLAARQVTIDPDLTQAEAQTLVRARLTALDKDNVTVSISKATSAQGLEMATLTARYPHKFTLPGIGEIGFTYHSTIVTPIPAAASG